MGLLDDKISNLEVIPDRFTSSVDRLRPQIIRQITEFILTLESQGGKLVLNEANLAILGNLTDALEGVLFESESEYLTALSEFVGSIKNQADLSNAYYGENFRNFQIIERYQTVLNNSQFQTIELFNKITVEQELTSKLKRTISNAMVSGEPLRSLFGEIDRIVAEDGLTQYTKTWARTAYAVSDRQYTATIDQELGVEWYEYVGGIIKNTRDFCKERAGFIFHKSEIESWPALDWQGKIQGTTSQTIYTNLGGWNCIHFLAARSADDVPEDVKARI